MDAFGHVNNTIYFSYFEDARLAYFWELGYNNPKTYRNIPNVFTESGIAPILSSTNCDFKKPLTFPDTIHIGAKVSGIEDKKIKMDHLIISEDQNEAVAEGEAIIVSYNYMENRSVNVPEEVKKRIEDIENESF